MKSDDFDDKINKLEHTLDDNRKAGRDLDKLWGNVRRDMLDESDVDTWWQRVAAQPKDEFENRLKEAFEKAKQTRDKAQCRLWPWIVRHNRPTTLTSSSADAGQRRRTPLVGKAILDTDPSPSAVEAGLPVEGRATLPFLLTARVQGELANCRGARAYFAEGLASSYEAFHHTREDRRSSLDLSDDGRKPDEASDKQGLIPQSLIPISWYEEQIAKLIPSQTDSRDKLLEHPKVRATVKRAVEIWSGGEKVLVFCYYRKTCLALYQHIRDEVEAETGRIAAKNLGLEYAGNEKKIDKALELARRRLSDAGPLRRQVAKLLSDCLDLPKYAPLASHSQKEDQKAELIKILTVLSLSVRGA